VTRSRFWGPPHPSPQPPQGACPVVPSRRRRPATLLRAALVLLQLPGVRILYIAGHAPRAELCPPLHRRPAGLLADLRGPADRAAVIPSLSGDPSGICRRRRAAVPSRPPEAAAELHRARRASAPPRRQGPPLPRRRRRRRAGAAGNRDMSRGPPSAGPLAMPAAGPIIQESGRERERETEKETEKERATPSASPSPVCRLAGLQPGRRAMLAV
jgi:hypothetical protein